MDLNALYNYADQQQIHIDCFDLAHIESLSIMDGSECYIGINPLILKSYAEEKVKLAHEVGHCETVSFYDKNTPWYIRERCEARAEKWAIKKLIPRTSLYPPIKTVYVITLTLLTTLALQKTLCKKL